MDPNPCSGQIGQLDSFFREWTDVAFKEAQPLFGMQHMPGVDYNIQSRCVTRLLHSRESQRPSPPLVLGWVKDRLREIISIVPRRDALGFRWHHNLAVIKRSIGKKTGPWLTYHLDDQQRGPWQDKLRHIASLLRAILRPNLQRTGEAVVELHLRRIP